MLLYKFLSSIYSLVVIITTIYSFYLLFKLKISKKQKYFYIYIFSVLFVDVIMMSIRSKFNFNQYYIYLPFIFISIVYFGLFYYLTFKSSFFKNFVTVASLLSLFLISLFIVLEKQKIISSNIYLILIIFYIVMSLLWFFYIINHIDEQRITYKQEFWVSCALLFWSIFALFRMYPLMEIYNLDKEFSYLFGNLFSIVNIITYLLFLKGLTFTNYNILRSFNYFKS